MLSDKNKRGKEREMKNINLLLLTPYFNLLKQGFIFLIYFLIAYTHETIKKRHIEYASKFILVLYLLYFNFRSRRIGYFLVVLLSYPTS